jgi:hypothetical protein
MTQQRGHGSGSGVAVSERVFQVFTLRAGLVIRQEDLLTDLHRHADDSQTPAHALSSSVAGLRLVAHVFTG